MDTGELVREFTNFSKAQKLFSFPDNRIAFFTGNDPRERDSRECNVFFSDLDGELVDSIKFYSKRETGSSGSAGSAYIKNNKIVYWTLFTDTAFQISHDLSQKPYVVFDYGIYKADPEIYNEADINQQRNKVFGGTISEAGNVIFLSLGVYPDMNTRMGIFDKTTGDLTFLSGTLETGGGLQNDLDGGLPFWPSWNIGDSIMYEVVHPYEINKYYEENEASPDLQYSFKTLAESLDENDNPVLMIVKLNE